MIAKKQIEMALLRHVDDMFFAYQKQENIDSGDIEPLDELELSTNIASLANIMYEILKKQSNK